MDPGSRVLRNKFGLTDPIELALAEEKFSRLRSQELTSQGVTGTFDLAHFGSIHGFLFQDVYTWAGQVRTVNISKGGTTFEKASRIPAALDGIHRSLKEENYLQGLGRVEFAQRLANYYGLWNAVHPFREGNGRSTRMLMGQLAAHSGWLLDVTRIDNREGQWNEASRLSFQGDLTRVTEVLIHAVRDPRAVVFERVERDRALRLYPDLESAFVAHGAGREAAVKAGMKGTALEIFDRALRRELARGLDDGVRQFSPTDLVRPEVSSVKHASYKPKL